jgi:hypothetical protein
MDILAFLRVSGDRLHPHTCLRTSGAGEFFDDTDLVAWLCSYFCRPFGSGWDFCREDAPA